MLQTASIVLDDNAMLWQSTVSLFSSMM